MKIYTFILLFLISCCQYAAAIYPQVDNTTDRSIIQLGTPLFLTDLINKGSIGEARRKAWVWHPAFSNFDSYSGLLTVNEAFNSNIFFWFFPSQTNYKNDPVILWFNNEPATSCLLTIFEHNGPISINSNGQFEPRNYSLTVNHSVIYMDIIGSGFSFTQDSAGQPKKQADVARDILLALAQFFQLFPELQYNEFYVGGNAYGGQYAVAIASIIKKINTSKAAYINLQGIILGNGLIDATRQKANAEFLYQVGLLDKKQRDRIKKIQDENRDVTSLLLEEKITGFHYFSNFLYYEAPDLQQYKRLIYDITFREAIHVGNMIFTTVSKETSNFIGLSLYKSIQKDLEDLLSTYQVLVFNGQMDFLFPYATSQDLYEQLKWPFAQEYKNAIREKWWLDGDLAGYVKTAHNFKEALIRNAGHVTFIEQPKWTCELITRFTHKTRICQEQKLFTEVRQRSTYISI